jgi:hypothetical protein
MQEDEEEKEDEQLLVEIPGKNELERETYKVISSYPYEFLQVTLFLVCYCALKYRHYNLYVFFSKIRIYDNG